MRVLIIGGSGSHPGGVEAFCERSRLALMAQGVQNIDRAPTDTAFISLRTLPRVLSSVRGLVRHCLKRPDCVWLQYTNMPDLIYLVVAKAFGLKVMVTPHLGSNWRSQSNRGLRSLSGSMLRLADRLALISVTQESEINLAPGTPRSLIRNFLPREVLEANLSDPAAAPEILQLIHSGRLSEGKGSFLVIEMCARLRDAGVPFCARITGGADEETYARLNAMIAEHGLGDHVSVLGRVPEDELLALLGRSDVLVHLSRIDSYPLIVLEAMACSMLPVVMELAGARDQVETYGGHVVSQGNAVVEAADWLAAQDLGELRRLGRAAAERVRADYAWARCANALEAALDACIAGDRQRLTRPEPTA